MDINQIRAAAGITESHNSSRKQQLIEQIDIITNRIKNEQLTEEQLNELFGGLGNIAKNAWGAAKAGAQKVNNAVQAGAANVKQQYQQGEQNSMEQNVVKAVTMLANQNQAKWAPVLQMVTKIMQAAQQPQQAAPQQGQTPPAATP